MFSSLVVFATKDVRQKLKPSCTKEDSWCTKGEACSMSIWPKLACSP